MSRFDYQEQVDRLKAACEWGALSRGRATLYAKLIGDLFAGRPRTDKHIFAVNESFEITDIHELWAPHTDRFPGIKAKICEALKSGPVVADDENPSTSSNRPRNDAFPFLLAGKLLAVGVNVLAVDGILATGKTTQWRGDITIRFHGRTLDIQCKRPFTSETVVDLASKGAKQIIDAGRPGTGFVALDLSRTIRPAGKVLPALSEQEIHRKVDKLLANAFPHDFMKTIARTKILGLITFGRVPVMLEKTGGSFVPFSASVTLVSAAKGNPNNVNMLKHLTKKLNESPLVS